MSVKRTGEIITNRTAAARRRAGGQAGQTAVVAIIVLFLLLFLAGIFIAIISGNIKNTKSAANTTQAGKYAEAGIKYLDDQLTNSPEGADWRPVPDCQYGTPCANIGQADPDAPWLRPCGDPSLKDADTCGFTRVNFGSDVPGSRERGATTGGRALVRLTYAPKANEPLSRYIKLEAVGRVGQIDAKDPTTYTSTEAISQKVELLAYKAIGLNEYVRQITNKDNKPGTVSLGAPFPVHDRDDRGNIVTRNIETILQGPIRVNAPLTFYGINRILLDPTRNEALEVSGRISLNNVSDTVANVSSTDATQVYISTVGLGNNIVATTVPNLRPSDSPAFTTLGPLVSQQNNGPGFALIRDNPSGSDTSGLPVEQDAFGNTYQNLRTVGSTKPPILDAVTGPDGLTRYRALTRASAPLPNIPKANENDPYYPMGTSDNPIGAGIYGDAGIYGWGQGFYIDNNNDVQNTSTTLFGGYSLRNDWLNPPAQLGTPFASANYWRGDFEYVPPAVTIILTPRGFTVEHSTYKTSRRQDYFFHNPANGDRMASVNKIYRYTPLPSFGPPTDFSPGAGGELKYAGYPANNFGPDGKPGGGDDTAYYEGDFVIHAEGNIRIKGVAGGLDPETKKYFIRHLTVSSNATIYIDGNLLRDNITTPLANADVNARNVRGRSTIALLAKNYIAVNTTQFLAPSDITNTVADNSGAPGPVGALQLSNSAPKFTINANFGPVFDPANPANGFVTPTYLTTDAAHRPSLFLRHTTSSDEKVPRDTYLNVLVNSADLVTPNKLLLGGIPGSLTSTDQITLSLGGATGLSPSTYALDRFLLTPSFLYPQNAYPYNAPNLTIGLNNEITLQYDQSANVSGTTPSGNYLASRVGVAPLDIRIEAMMYAQEYSFFIIPGPWFNPNPNDTMENYVDKGYRDGEVTLNAIPSRRHTEGRYPFFKQPMDIRITFCGSITENLPAEIADQGAWQEKWGWVPDYYGSTGLGNAPNYFTPGGLVSTVHGRLGSYPGGDANNNGKGNGLVYEFDNRSIAPYAPSFSGIAAGMPLRPNPYNPTQPLPFAPRLPVAPGFLYYGQNTQR